MCSQGWWWRRGFYGGSQPVPESETRRWARNIDGEEEQNTMISFGSFVGGENEHVGKR
jgi:hypothetical protein